MHPATWIVIGLIIAVGIVVILRRDAPKRAEPDPAAIDANRRLAALLRTVRRAAFDPVVEEGDTSDPVSKFGGLPWMPTGAGWPQCPGCKHPMRFFVQLDVDSLPTEAGVQGAGLIQLFMCTTPDKMTDICLESWQHGSASASVRLVDTGAEGRNATAPSEDAVWPARRIVAWEKLEDLPGYDDLGLAGIEVTDEFSALWEQAEQWIERTPTTHEGDKLGGWPHWVQSPEYGTCGACGRRMDLVLQIDSEDNVPFMFGDAGMGYLCQCHDHPNVLTWGWACY